MARVHSAKSNTAAQGGTGGTLGGIPRAAGARPSRINVNVGDEMYLWLLVVLEALAIGWLRQRFRRRHGG